jgi:protein-disulfide isomerase
MSQKLLNYVFAVLIAILGAVTMSLWVELSDIQYRLDQRPKPEAVPAPQSVDVSLKANRALNEKYANAVDKITTRHIYGDLSAQVTLAEYSDTRCPYCKTYQPTIKRVVDGSGGRVNLEYRHFVLSSHLPVAGVQAVALECVAKQVGNRHFWAYLDHTFMANPTTKEDHRYIAEQLGIGPEIIPRCAVTKKANDAVNVYRQEANQWGVSTTPSTLVINNQTGKTTLLQGVQNEQTLIRAIQSVLR